MRWINEEDLIAYYGFSTSIYDMHTDDEDCCAMAGCGFCLQARNHHIYHRDEAGYTPKSFWKSILLYGLPAVIYVSAVSVKAMSVATSAYDDEAQAQRRGRHQGS